MISRLEQGSLVTVFGGSGFVGRHAVRALAADGWRVRAAVRRPDLAGHLQPMGAVGQIHAVQANVRYPDSVRRAVEGADAVVNLVGILAKSGRQTFEAVHVDGRPRHRRGGARSRRQDPGARLGHRRRQARESQLCAHQGGRRGGRAARAFPDAVILRPSLVFGPEDQLFNRFAAMAGFSPFLPLIGGGRTKLQPVYVGDVAAAIAAACAGKAKPRTIYELGGPEVVTFRAAARQDHGVVGPQRRYLRIPFWAGQARRAAHRCRCPTACAR